MAPFDLTTQMITCSICNTGKGALPDMYAILPEGDISVKVRVPVLQLISGIAKPGPTRALARASAYLALASES